MTEKNGTTTTNATPKARPAWEVFFVGEDGKVMERTWEDKHHGTQGTTWNKRGALWPTPPRTAPRFCAARSPCWTVPKSA